MRAKRAKLSTAIEMMRREAVHNAFNAARGGPSPTADGAGDEEGALSGMDARRAQEWVAISEIPSYRLVHFVFECIDADRSGGLTALPVNPPAHQSNPPRPPQRLLWPRMTEGPPRRDAGARRNPVVGVRREIGSALAGPRPRRR